MTARILNLGPAPHQQAQELLPWYVMGTLAEEEHRLVAEHLQSCAACQREIAWQQQLRAANAEPLPARDVDRAFAALRARLPATTPTLAQRASLWRARIGLEVRPWIGWTLAAQTAAILLLAGLVGVGAVRSGTERTASFHVLSRPSAAQPPARLVVAFAPQTSLAELRRILLASGTRIVDGPTAADAYILSVAPERAEPALQLLRAEPAVVLIQSLDTRDSR